MNLKCMILIQTVDMVHACPTLIKYPPLFHPCRPLHLAAALCKVPEIIDLLLDGGAEVDAKNNSLSTPLSTACQANNPYAASRLITKGVQLFLFKQYSLAICLMFIGNSRPYLFCMPLGSMVIWLHQLNCISLKASKLKYYNSRETRNLLKDLYTQGEQNKCFTCSIACFLPHLLFTQSMAGN